MNNRRLLAYKKIINSVFTNKQKYHYKGSLTINKFLKLVSSNNMNSKP